MKDLIQQNGALPPVNTWVLCWWTQQPVVHPFVEWRLSEDLLNRSGTSVTHSVAMGSKATRGLENTGEGLWISLRKNGKWSETLASPTSELSLGEEGRGGGGQRHLNVVYVCACVCVQQRWAKEDRDVLLPAGFSEGLPMTSAQWVLAEGVNGCLLNVFTVPYLASWPHPLALGFLFSL